MDELKDHINDVRKNGIIIYNPIFNTCFITNRISLQKIAVFNATLEQNQKRFKNYKLNTFLKELKEPFLDRLYKMKGLVY